MIAFQIINTYTREVVEMGVDDSPNATLASVMEWGYEYIMQNRLNVGAEMVIRVKRTGMDDWHKQVVETYRALPADTPDKATHKKVPYLLVDAINMVVAKEGHYFVPRALTADEAKTHVSERLRAVLTLEGFAEQYPVLAVAVGRKQVEALTNDMVNAHA